jgi:large subunit ribosomal protein L7/L12
MYACSQCGAPLVATGIVRCGYCGALIPPDPTLGALLAEADFRRPDPPGWVFPHAQYVRHSPPAELLVQTPPGAGAPVVLASQARFDDLDARLVFRILWGDTGTTYAGMCVRQSEAGEYRAFIATDGTCFFGHQPASGKGEARRFLPWARHDAVRKEPGAPNELRMVCTGNRIRVFVNGAQIAAVHDDSEKFGRVGVITSSKVAMAVALSSLSVWVSPRDAAVTPQPVDVAPQDVVLVSINRDRKIMTIKVVRDHTGLGLKEAKDLVETPNVIVKQRCTPEQARRLSRELEELGARVLVRASSLAG